MVHKSGEIEATIKSFNSIAIPDHRYSSFDYCYNYFSTNNNFRNDIEKSCLMLGFYLASWGMLRGSSFLLQKSSKYLQGTVEYISDLDRNIWNIDIDNYNDENIQIIIDLYAQIKKLIIKDKSSDLTLITKIILGVFGFIPAFDQYFCNTFREIFKDQKCGFRKVNYNSLSCIKAFYEGNNEIIDKLARETFTKDFITGEATQINYPKAKIIDMYGFTLGFNKDQKKRNP